MRFLVDRHTYDKTIEVLRTAFARAQVGRNEKIEALKRLAVFSEQTSETVAG
jgi:hypothetical protein